jgi:hypothetical protein
MAAPKAVKIRDLVPDGNKKRPKFQVPVAFPGKKFEDLTAEEREKMLKMMAIRMHLVESDD